MKWTYTTKGNEESEIPLEQNILVQFKSSTGYEVLWFSRDEEYGICAPAYETYIFPKEIKKFIIITD